MLETQQKITVIDGCNPADIPAWIYQSDEPLILKGLVADWPVVKKAVQSNASISEYLSGFYNGKPVTYYYGEPDIKGRIFYTEDFNGFNFKRSEANLNQILTLLQEHEQNPQGPMFYVGSTRVDEWLPGFREQNDLVMEGVDPLVSIWLGNCSAIGAHYDCPDNIACNVAGKRTFTLFPPEQLENLYVGPLDITPSGRALSMVDFAQPDFDKYPRFKMALETARIAELEAGDAVFIPSMWWHHVQAHTSLNVLVNYWWRSIPDNMGNPESVLYHALLSLRELPKTQRSIWKNILNYYIFEDPDGAIEHIPENIRGVLGTRDELVARKIRSYLINSLKR